MKKIIILIEAFLVACIMNVTAFDQTGNPDEISYDLEEDHINYEEYDNFMLEALMEPLLGSVTPFVVTDPEHGRVVRKKTGVFENKVYRMGQWDVSPSAYLTDEYGNPATNSKGNLLDINGYGCALASQAMVANYMAGYTDEAYISIIDANSKIEYTAEYAPSRFVSAYGSYLKLDNGSRYLKKSPQKGMSSTSAVDYIAPLINKKSLAIIGGRNSSGTHYVVVNGYAYTDYTYEDGFTLRDYDYLIITDPGFYERRYYDMSAKKGKDGKYRQGYAYEWPTIYDIAVYIKK